MRRVVITGAPPVQLLDVSGPLEVFSNAAGYTVELATPEGGDALRTNRGIDLRGAVALAQCAGPIDTLIVVGGPGAEGGGQDAEFVR